MKIVKELDMVPEMQASDLDIIKNNTVDLLGSTIISHGGSKRKKRLSILQQSQCQKIILMCMICQAKMNPYRGWEIYEKGIYDILINLRDNYGNLPCFISENGMGLKMNVVS